MYVPLPSCFKHFPLIWYGDLQVGVNDYLGMVGVFGHQVCGSYAAWWEEGN